MRSAAIFSISFLRSICLVLLLWSGSTVTSVAQESDDAFQRGLLAFEDGDFTGALRLWQPLAEQGSADAQLGLGVIYMDGLAEPQDDTRAAGWFALAAEQGSAEAAYNLGFLFFSGRGLQQDLQQAKRWFAAAADQGHAEANYYLGTMYAGGYGAQRDEVLAYAHFERAFAAASGDLKDLAERSRESVGRRLGAPDLERARQLAQATTALAGSYEAGLAAFEARDYDSALANWRPLAKEGVAPAQQGLGVLYHDGLGVASDRREAARWFTLAAEQGLAESQYNLGLLLFAGDAIDKDQKAAARWFGLAGDQRHAEANYYLGTMLAGGAVGVSQDDEKAYRRFLLATQSDPEPGLAVLARQGLDTISRRLSPAQLARIEEAGGPAKQTPAIDAAALDTTEEAGRRVGALAEQITGERAAERATRDNLQAARERAEEQSIEVDVRRTELTTAQSDLEALEQQLAGLDQRFSTDRSQREEAETAVRKAEEREARTEAARQVERRNLEQAVQDRSAAEQRIRELTQQLQGARAARQAALDADTAASELVDQHDAKVEEHRRTRLASQEELGQIDARLAKMEAERKRLVARQDASLSRVTGLTEALKATLAAESAAAQAVRDATVAARGAAQQVAVLEDEQTNALKAADQGQTAARQTLEADTAPTLGAGGGGRETQIAVAQELEEKAAEKAVADAELDAQPPSSELVRTVQTALASLGYDAGLPDGIFGAKTVDAVKSFQVEEGLPQTGILTQELAFLLSLLAEREDRSPPLELELAGSGTGFVVTDDGSVLTNNHVIEACEEVRVQYAGESYVVDHVASDPGADLALLDGSFAADEFVVFRGGRGIRPGEDVVALGFPLQGRLSDQVKVTKGTISALSGPGNDRTLIQTTAPVQAGSSGGPLFDMSGNVVGVVVGKISAVEVENVSFAINGSIARIFLDAEGVRYATLRSDEPQSAADVAERGRRATVLIECWNAKK